MKFLKYILAILCASVMILGGRHISNLTASLRGEQSVDDISEVERPIETSHDVIPAPAAVHHEERFQLDAEIQARVDEILARGSRPSSREVEASLVTVAQSVVTAAEEPLGHPLSSPKIELPLLDIPDARVLNSPSIRNAAGVSKSKSIRHQAPLHERMLTPGNFLYLGGFRPPHFDRNQAAFSLGGWGITLRPDGDPSGAPDSCPGSLYIVGSQAKQLVAEISIPEPYISGKRIIDELPVAEILQQFGDITGGIREQLTAGSSEPFQIGGMQFVGNRLHWTIYKYYNVETHDYFSHGTSSPFTSRPFPEGLWHLGPVGTGQSVWHSYKHAGYIFEIPDAAAKNWFGGRNLISGLQIATGLNIASHGPAMYAYSLPAHGTAHGTSLDAVPLVVSDIDRPAPGFHPADRWTGGAWLTLGNKHAVIIAGRKSLGPVYYGDARPQDCTPDKGFHGTPYEAQILFYSPEMLAHAARQSVDPYQVTPWLQWNQDTPGGDFSQYLFPSCNQHIGGVTYDRKNSLLYVCQIDAGATRDFEYEFLPVIHVFRIVD